ncbi:MAG: hypothetical protein HC915_02200 [Anaerolineae bacterium]|nr:hypothetical protein [Anaerolineae bacterium]
MQQSELVGRLDAYFQAQRYNEQEHWLGFLAEAQKSSARPHYAPAFWEGTWNGLMLDNTQTVDRVYLVVFPTREIIDTIIAREVGRGAPGALIFAHHPFAYDESEGRFTPIPLEQLEELREHHISTYICHAPLDCHSEISTGTALASAIGLNDLARFGEHFGGYAGVIGNVPATPFQAFAERLAKACELQRLRYDQILHAGQPVRRVALVAGGGGTPHFIDEAANLGADTFVTGHWHLFADSPFAQERREAFRTYIPTLKINLLGTSHYSSEMVVMRDTMKGWFVRELDLETFFIPQENPWSA